MEIVWTVASVSRQGEFISVVGTVVRNSRVMASASPDAVVVGLVRTVVIVGSG